MGGQVSGTNKLGKEFGSGGSKSSERPALTKKIEMSLKENQTAVSKSSH